MTLFVTHLEREDGSLWDGPRVEADSWEEAEESCRRIGEVLTSFKSCKLVGEFIAEVSHEADAAKHLAS